MVFTRTEPGAGEPESIIAAGYERGTRAHEIRIGALGGLSGARNRISGSTWQGDGANAYQASLDTVITQVEPLATELEAEAFALVKYGNQVGTIKSKAQALQTSIDNATDDLMDLQKQDSLRGPETPPSLSPSKPPAADDSALFRDNLTQSIETKQGELRAFDAQWDTLYSERVAADNEFVAALTGSGVRGGLAGVPAGGPTALDTSALLALLATLSASEIGTLFSLYPGLGESLRDVPADQVAAWWFGYSDPADPLNPTAEQLALVAAMPLVLGNLDGVAYWARDQANRIVLDIAIAHAQAISAQNLDTLLAIRDSLGPDGEQPPRQLVSLSDLGMLKPLAAVSVGNLDKALYTNFQVSGMYSSTSSMPEAVTNAAEMYSMMVNQAYLYGTDGPFAVVAWIGYDSPSTVGVTSMKSAEAGAERFIDLMRGYRSTTAYTVPDSFVTVEAHSYGTTTVMLALSQEDLGVDALALYGSAGAPPTVDSTEDLNVPAGQIYAGENWDDPWAHMPRDIGFPAREDPRTFPGTTQFETSGPGLDPVSGEYLAPTHGHEEYLKPRSESQRNLAVIALGLGNEATKVR